MRQEITIIGYLGRDPEMRYLDTGTAVCDFTMAASRKYTKKNGDRVDETTWFDVTVWGKTAENAYKYLKKGSPVYVRGRMRPNANGYPRVYQADNGEWRAKFEVIADEVLYLPSSGKSQTDDNEELQDFRDLDLDKPDEDDSFIF